MNRGTNQQLGRPREAVKVVVIYYYTYDTYWNSPAFYCNVFSIQFCFDVSIDLFNQRDATIFPDPTEISETNLRAA